MDRNFNGKPQRFSDADGQAVLTTPLQGDVRFVLQSAAADWKVGGTADKNFGATIWGATQRRLSSLPCRGPSSPPLGPFARPCAIKARVSLSSDRSSRSIDRSPALRGTRRPQCSLDP